MVDGLAVGKVIPPLSPPGRIKGVSPENGRGGERRSDSPDAKRPEGGRGRDKVDEDETKKDGETAQGSKIDICV